MNILHLNSSPRREASYSRKLGSAIVSRLQEQHPDSTVKVRDLMNPVFPQMEEVHLASFFTPKEGHTPDLTEAIRHSDTAIAELMSTDAIVIEAPMYNFGITSSLKSWIDHIARAGKTFSYSAAGPEGLVKDKKGYLAITTGGIYTEGPYKPYDFTENYLRTILGFMGMTDIQVFRLEGTNMPELKESAVTKAMESVNQFSF